MQLAGWTILLALNTLWFGMGAFHFSLRPHAAARMLAARAQRTSPLFHTLSDAIRFLGGLNLAFAVFCLLLLVFADLFPERGQRALFAAALALAHASQFMVNVLMLGKHRRQEAGAWPVLEGPMLFIFAIDGVLTVANGIVALWIAR